MTRCALLRGSLVASYFLAALLACSSPPVTEPRSREQQPAQVSTPPAPDPLRCPLAVQTHVLTEVDVTALTAPVVTPSGDVLVALLDADENTFRLHTRRLDRAGTLHEPELVATERPMGHPRLARASDGRLFAAVAGREDRVVELSAEGRLERTAPISLAEWAEDLAIGPRGFITSHDFASRVVRIGRDGTRHEWELPRPESIRDPYDPVLAAGTERDVVLVRDHASTRRWRVHVLPRSSEETPTVHELLGGDSHVAIAAGSRGFAVVADENDQRIVMRLLDATGAPSGPVRPITEAVPDELQWTPRVAALGDGWVVSYVFRGAPTVLRTDAEGNVIGEPIAFPRELHTGPIVEARMTALADGIAMSWQMVRNNWHYVENEIRGARLSVMRCETAPMR